MPAPEFLSGPARQAAVLEETDHRPWPLPAGSWIMAQTWDDLLFAHWGVPPEALQPLLPSGLTLDEFDGTGWLGITPFVISGFRLRGTFPELNVRTYVSAGGKPGIWFFSLDTSSQLAVEGARRTYKLPYFRARMSVDRRGETVDYSSVRSGDARPFVFQARYRPRGEVSQSQPGSLEHFLTERYCLFAAEGERLFRADIHHPPWPLRGAEIELELNTMAPNGIELPDEVLLLHFSHRQDVLIWPLEPVGSEPV